MSESWEDVAHQRDGLPPGWRRHGRDAHLDLIRRWVGDPEGRWLKTDLYEELDDTRALLPRLGTAEWVGMDVALAAARAAATSVQADVRRLPFDDGAFAGVLSTSTLDHFFERRDIDVSLRELRRVIAPGGVLVLTLDNAWNPLIALRNALPPNLRAKTGLAPFHVGPTLGAAAARAAVAAAGFEIVAVEHLLHAPHVVGTRLARFGRWERRALPALDRLGRTGVARFSGHFVAVLARVPR